MINGVDTDYQTIRDWQTSTGDFFTADDVRTSRKVAVLGNTVAQNLFPGQRPGRRRTSRSATRSSKSSACSRRKGRPPAAATPTTSC